MKEITVCITSCGRLDLLDRTLESFLLLNNYPVKQYILNDDSGDKEIHKKIIDKWGNLFTVIFPAKKAGQSKALDRMYSIVDTEYIFGLEDDWEFSGNPDFIQEGITILEDRKDIHQVWIRDFSDHHHPTENTIYNSNGVDFKMMAKGYLGNWGGFSWNPRVCRKSDWLKFFPNGFNEIKEEFHCNNHAVNLGWRAATLLKTSCHHIGYQQHTKEYMW